MKKKKVISRKSIKSGLPVFPWILMWLFLDRIQAPGYVYGIIGTILFFWAIGVIYQWLTCEEVDLFDK